MSVYEELNEDLNTFSNSLPRGALKLTISNDLSDPVTAFPSIDSGFITKSLNVASGMLFE